MDTGNNNIDDILNDLIESIEVLNGNTEQFNIILLSSVFDFCVINLSV